MSATEYFTEDKNTDQTTVSTFDCFSFSGTISWWELRDVITWWTGWVESGRVVWWKQTKNQQVTLGNKYLHTHTRFDDFRSGLLEPAHKMSCRNNGPLFLCLVQQHFASSPKLPPSTRLFSVYLISTSTSTWKPAAPLMHLQSLTAFSHRRKIWLWHKKHSGIQWKRF